MTQTRTRTGVQIPSEDGTDFWGNAVSFLRGIGDKFNDTTLLWAGANPRASRPAAGTAGRIFRPTDRRPGILDFDDGTAWSEIGASTPPGATTDGIINDTTGGSFKVTVADSTHLSVAAGQMVIRGVLFNPTAATTLTKSGASYDFVVARLTAATSVVTLAVIGSNTPTLTQNDTTWELPVARVGSGGSVGDLRTWAVRALMSDPGFVSDAQAPGQTAPLGTYVITPRVPTTSTPFNGSEPTIRLRALVGPSPGTPDWVMVSPRPWNDIPTYTNGSDRYVGGGDVVPYSGLIVTNYQPLRWRQRDNALYLSGTRTHTASTGGSPTTMPTGWNKVAVFTPPDPVPGYGKYPFTAVTSEYSGSSSDSSSWNEYVVPGYAIKEDDGSWSVWVRSAPSGSPVSVHVNTVIQSTADVV